MNISPDTQIGEVVKLNFKTAPLFQANNIDFCCGGDKTISEACIESGVEPAVLIQELKKIAESVDPDTEYINSLKYDELIDYIIKRHHVYVRNNIPFIQKNLEKLCQVHGSNHPELFEINKLFNETAGELTMHMQKEEIMVFPYIKKLVKAKEENTQMQKAPFGSISSPIAMMIAEHETEGRRFEKIAELANDYALPSDGCTTYKVTLNHLSNFEDDLHRHIHLENNILFPGALTLETELERNN